MMVHAQARRGQLLYGHAAGSVSAREREAGKRVYVADDRGREAMPFDRFVLELKASDTRAGLFGCDIVSLMESAFGGR